MLGLALNERVEHNCCLSGYSDGCMLELKSRAEEYKCCLGSNQDSSGGSTSR